MMPSQMTIWHNPRCAKSRAALALLQDAGHQPSVRLYLADPPNEAEVVAVRNALGVTADEMMRKGEKLFKELGLATVTETELVDAMVAHPWLTLVSTTVRLTTYVEEGQSEQGRKERAR